MSKATTRTIFMLLEATPSWLALRPDARDQFVNLTLRPILGRHAHVRLRYFDAEAYSARTTDVLMWDVSDDEDYRDLVDDLRDTLFWGTYFLVREIIPCIEDDFARHHGVEGLAR
jgi:hypothetical protein